MGPESAASLRALVIGIRSLPCVPAILLIFTRVSMVYITFSLEFAANSSHVDYRPASNTSDIHPRFPSKKRESPPAMRSEAS
jgi:hypothetical protein